MQVDDILLHIIMPPKNRKDGQTSTTDEKKTDENSTTNLLLEQILFTVNENKSTLAANSKRLETMETKMEVITNDVRNVESRVGVVEKTISDATTTIFDVCKAARNMEIANIRNEENSRRFNVIAYNVKHTAEHENRATSFDKVYEILRDVFGIDNPGRVNVCEAHRLPTKSGEGRKPLIFKLTSMLHKDILWDHLSNVKLYNESVHVNEKISINMTHLPAKLLKDKEDLKDKYDTAKTAGKSPKWRYIKSTGQYCLKIGDKLIKSPNDNFSTKLIDVKDLQAVI